MFTRYLEKLGRREDLTSREMSEATRQMLVGAPDSEVSAFLALLENKGAVAEELDGLVLELRKRMLVVPVQEPVLDIVGTGGDRKDTVNISTAAAIVAASCGAKVAKHGNRAVSSRCGSADFIEALGIPLKMSSKEAALCIERCGIGFLFAPCFHPAMRAVQRVRRELGKRTIFNLAGPLLNPAKASAVLLGVADPAHVLMIAQVLVRRGIKRAIVFHASGLDELTPLGPAEGIEIERKEMTPFIFAPSAPKCHLKDLQGSDLNTNHRILLGALGGKPGAVADAVAMNAGVGLYLAEHVSSIQEGIARAYQTLEKGHALGTIDRWKQEAHRVIS